MNRHITNEEFEQACDNSNYMKIIHSISTKYIRRGMDVDNARQCGLIGLWYALKYWDKNYKIKCKFTTYLYKVVVHQFIQKCKQRHSLLSISTEYLNAIKCDDYDHITNIDWLDSINLLPLKNKDIMVLITNQ